MMLNRPLIQLIEEPMPRYQVEPHCSGDLHSILIFALFVSIVRMWLLAIAHTLILFIDVIRVNFLFCFVTRLISTRWRSVKRARAGKKSFEIFKISNFHFF